MQQRGDFGRIGHGQDLAQAPALALQVLEGRDDPRDRLQSSLAGLEFGLLSLQVVQLSQERPGGAAFVRDGLGDVVDTPARVFEISLEAGLLGLEVGISLGGLFDQLAVAGGDHVGIQDDFRQVLEDGVLQQGAGNVAGGALVAFRAGAGVVFVAIILGFTKHDHIGVHHGAAARAKDQAGKQEGRPFAAGMVLAAAHGVGVPGLDCLDGLPQITVDDRFAVILDDLVGEFQLTDVDAVGEKMAEVVGGLEKMSRLFNIVVGGVCSAHLKGLADDRDHLGIRHPAVDDVWPAVAALADLDSLAFETTRRCATQRAVLVHQVTQASLDVGAQVIEVARVHPVDGGLEEAAVEAFGDGVVERVDDETAAAQVGLVKGCVIQVSRKTVEFPDDDPSILTTWRAEILNHFVKSDAADGGGAGRGGIDKTFRKQEPIFLTPGADADLLLLDGEFLVLVAGVAQVGDDPGIGLKRYLCSIISHNTMLPGNRHDQEYSIH